MALTNELANTVWPTATPLDGADTTLLWLGVVSALLIWLQAYPLSAQAWLTRAQSAANSVSGGAIDVEQARHTRAVLRERLAGGVALLIGALATAFALRLPTDWLGLPRPAASALWVVGALALLLPFVVRSATQPAMMERYPEIREPTWTRRLAAQSLAATTTYLLGYEAFFRGLITLGLVSLLGVWPGLSIATAIYVTQHLRKPAAEAFACLPMGFFFGLMTLQTGSVWAAWLVHVLVATTNEVLSARENPELNYPLWLRPQPHPAADAP